MLRRGLSSCLPFALALSCPLHAAALVTDEGQVDVVSSGVLAIGSDAFGRRTVDASTDGPYSSTNLGLGMNGHGELLLQNGGRYGVPGPMTVGFFGGGIVRVTSGSSLETGSAVLYAYDLPDPVGFLADPIRVHIDGIGSRWLNSGLLELGSRFGIATIDLGVSAGAELETLGVVARGRNIGDGRADILVEGAGSSWENLGSLVLADDASFTLRDGARAVDAGVQILGDFFRSHALVQGAGSAWSTGDLVLATSGVGLAIENGATVHSASATLATQTTEAALVSGTDSAWSIDGSLRVLTHPFGGSSRLSVLAGGSLITGDAMIGDGASGSATVEVIGTDASWANQGLLALGGGGAVRSRLAILEGATVTTLGIVGRCSSSGFLPGRCEIDVSGAGSALTVAGSVRLEGDGSMPGMTGRLAVSDDGRVSAGGSLVLTDGAELQLDGGAVHALRVDLAAGSLSGRGEIHADVENAGLVRPGTPAGRLVVHGNYQQAPSGVLAVELGGPTPADGYDVLEIIGTSFLGGTLSVSLIDGYRPNLGDSFQVLSSAALTGAFDAYAGLDLGGDLRLEVEVLSTGVRLITVPEPATGALLTAGLLVLSSAARQRGPLVPRSSAVGRPRHGS